MAVCTSFVLASSAAAREARTGVLETVRELRLEGALTEAIEAARRGLEEPDLEADDRVALHLELARSHDRVGLHQNSRPVTAAWRHIEAAQAAAENPSVAVRGSIQLAKADYHYRAEMGEREFQNAMPLAEDAIRLFEQAGDTHGQADAVHKLGLIHFQRGEYDRARELFDRSLELDLKAGKRPAFCGDYQRHVGFIHVREGDTAGAIPYFERSLACRRMAGATDASLFAASLLGSVLVGEGRVNEAKPHLLYAMMLAEKLGSPHGKARVGLVLGRMYERLKDPQAARSAYEMTRRIAETIDLSSIVRRCTSAVDRLDADAVSTPRKEAVGDRP